MALRTLKLCRTSNVLTLDRGQKSQINVITHVTHLFLRLLIVVIFFYINTHYRNLNPSETSVCIFSFDFFGTNRFKYE